jgi:hypothetical protein
LFFVERAGDCDISDAQLEWLSWQLLHSRLLVTKTYIMMTPAVVVNLSVCFQCSGHGLALLILHLCNQLYMLILVQWLVQLELYSCTAEQAASFW